MQTGTGLARMGVACRACLEGPFYHKPHDKYMVSTGSVTSTGRTCDLHRGGDAAASIYHDRRAHKYYDRTTVDELTEEDTKDYKRYIQRHDERRDTARRADKLVQLVGEHNPNIEEELRIYMGKHPWKVAQLLAEEDLQDCCEDRQQGDARGR